MNQNFAVHINLKDQSLIVALGLPQTFSYGIGKPHVKEDLAIGALEEIIFNLAFPIITSFCTFVF